MMAGVDLVPVQYRSSAPVLTDLMAGQVQVTFGPLGASIEYIKDCRLRALAVTEATRSETLPDVPTVGEFVPGYEASLWQGIGAPKGTPPEIIDRLNKEINAALADSRIKARLADLGSTPFAQSTGDFARLIASDTEKWGKVIRAANIKADYVSCPGRVKRSETRPGHDSVTRGVTRGSSGHIAPRYRARCRTPRPGFTRRFASAPLVVV